MTMEVDTSIDLQSIENPEIIDIKEIYNSRITERDIFNIGRLIIFGSGILFFVSLIAYMIRPLPGSEVIELCRTVLLPVLTLVIGFYFSD